ncbi:Similar to K02A2.6: Uncharacterized protein K02A2.6 (Caenorhabditis elegans) [Cotesia congregata]|uniref:Similar to K02A2.6: Uncharacterized protein K02A2.6 (Caenorhabditis elegans) n=1 Tax=Cotesia congregata TaxID=51543 RepID=A0A8J2H721_COTCN|nr:Similar to K02A2.6: Uncharacterized protein K02A2.6 (Caenorhabditis elegans) [Cotesia congregata]
MPRSVRGKTHILVAYDVYTRYLEAEAVNTPTGKGVVDFLRRVFATWGTARVIISDNGTEFCNKLVEEFCNDRKIKHELTPTYHPQSNPVERVNRNLKIMIRSYLIKKQNIWDQYLFELKYAYNTSIHSSLNVSPAYLNFGRDPIYLDQYRDKLDVKVVDDSKTREDMLKYIDEMRHYVEKCMNKTQERRRALDTPKPPIDLLLGTEVYIRNRKLSKDIDGISSKLLPYMRGPFFIKSYISASMVELVNENGESMGNFHISTLKIPSRSNRINKRIINTEKMDNSESTGVPDLKASVSLMRRIKSELRPSYIHWQYADQDESLELDNSQSQVELVEMETSDSASIDQVTVVSQTRTDIAVVSDLDTLLNLEIPESEAGSKPSKPAQKPVNKSNAYMDAKTFWERFPCKGPAHIGGPATSENASLKLIKEASGISIYQELKSKLVLVKEPGTRNINLPEPGMVNTEPLLVTHHETLGEIRRESKIDIRQTMRKKEWDAYITRQVSHYLQQNSPKTRDVETQTVETRNFPFTPRGCIKCKQIGHAYKNCQNDAFGEEYCTNCWKIGHRNATCPFRDRKTVEWMRHHCFACKTPHPMYDPQCGRCLTRVGKAKDDMGKCLRLKYREGVDLLVPKFY